MEKKWLWILGVVLAVGAVVTLWVERTKNQVESDRSADSVVEDGATPGQEKAFSDGADRALDSENPSARRVPTTPVPETPPADSSSPITPPPVASDPPSYPPPSGFGGSGPMTDSGGAGYDAPNYDAPPPPPPMDEDFAPPPPPPSYGGEGENSFDGGDPSMPPPPPPFPESPPPYEDFAPPAPEEY